MIRVASLLFSVLLLFLPAAGQEVLPLSRLNGTIVIDGLSNDEAWQSVAPLPVVMHIPTHEAPLSEPTEIRIAYDSDYLYVSGLCFDSDPKGVQANSQTRDGMTQSDDFFGILLDTFNDNENGLTFITNPAGLREDWAVFNDGEPLTQPFPFNSSWSTFWDVAVTRTEEGWFVEMKIPLSSLRFEDHDGRVVMGLMAWRYIARKNEVHVYPNIPPKWTFSLIKPSVAQDISFEGIASRNPFYVTPYVLGGGGRNSELNSDSSAYRRLSSLEREIGLDVKYGLTSNLTLDLTVNTDFAQVEADDQQVNLTRFSLFFPEKRLFFQERGSIFDVPLGGPERLFYSRQIGLSEEGPVRIYGGARLIGRVGEWDLGFLDMQTATSKEFPAENFAVLRLRRRVLNENSYAGTMFTSRAGNDGSFNYTYGLDGTFRVSGDDYMLVNWAQSFDSDLVKPRHRTGLNVAKIRLQIERRTNVGFGYEGSIGYSGSDFDPAMGFVPRENYMRFGDRIFYGWLAPESSSIYNQVVTFRANTFLNNDSRSLESSEVGTEWLVGFKSGSFGLVSLKMFQEVLAEPFELSDVITIPVGRYRFYAASALFESPWGALLRGGLTLEGGTFYDGSRISASFRPFWSVSKHLEMSGEYQVNRIRFSARNQEFTAHIVRMRVKATLDTKLSGAMFLQFNSEAHDIIANFRLRYNPQEGTDFYLVYNEGINTDRFRELPHLPNSDSRTLLLKFSYTFLF